MALPSGFIKAGREGMIWGRLSKVVLFAAAIIAPSSIALAECEYGKSVVLSGVIGGEANDVSADIIANARNGWQLSRSGSGAFFNWDAVSIPRYVLEMDEAKLKVWGNTVMSDEWMRQHCTNCPEAHASGTAACDFHLMIGIEKPLPPQCQYGKRFTVTGTPSFFDVMKFVLVSDISCQ